MERANERNPDLPHAVLREGGEPVEDWMAEDEPLRAAFNAKPQMVALMDRVQRCLEEEGVEFPVCSEIVGHYALPLVQIVDDCAETLRAVGYQEDRVRAAVKLVEVGLMLCSLYGVNAGDIMEEVGA